jgi:hypothetical protein
VVTEPHVGSTPCPSKTSLSPPPTSTQPLWLWRGARRPSLSALPIRGGGRVRRRAPPFLLRPKPLASWGRVRGAPRPPPWLTLSPSHCHTYDAHSPALPETWHHRLCVQLTLLYTASRLPRRRRSSDPAQSARRALQLTLLYTASRLPRRRRSSDRAQSARRALSLPDATDPPRACRRGCRRGETWASATE